LLSRFRLDLERVIGIRRLAVRLHEVRCDHLDGVLILTRRLQERRRRQMTRLAIAFGEGVVSYLPDQVLQESVLAALGRERIHLRTEHLFANQR